VRESTRQVDGASGPSAASVEPLKNIALAAIAAATETFLTAPAKGKKLR
jgi:hypothetical protein